MKQTWRWFGPNDPVTLSHVKQAGASGVVTALHHIKAGEAWSKDDVQARRAEIENAGLEWSVVESIPVHEDIKLRSGDWRRYIGTYKDSLRAVASAGVSVVCYNFMAITDWSRTDLEYRLPHGGTALRYDAVDFAVYDLFILKRKDAERDHSVEMHKLAGQRFKMMSEEKKQQIEANLIGAVPARDFTFNREGFRTHLAHYDGMTAQDFRDNLAGFLREIIPAAAELNIRMCIHPDDPPFSLFGLPRVVSTVDDLRAILGSVDESANGITFCTGSLGARADNDLPAMATELAKRIHFVHLRNVAKEKDGSFTEADHLGGDTDMIAVIKVLMAEEKRRRAEQRIDAELPFRPDHGHRLIDDMDKKVNPGYSCIGRLKGLAELRGVMTALSALGH